MIVQVHNKVEETFEKPKQIIASNIMYYYPKYEQLNNTKCNKARKFIEYDCIEQLTPNSWICKAIKGYNKTKYTITLNSTNNYECNCQHFTKEGTECSHILALKFKQFQMGWNNEAIHKTM